MKKIWVLLLTIALLMGLVVTVSAVGEEYDFVELEEPQDVVFAVSWEGNTKPEFVFIAPDGTQYDPDQTYTNTMTAISDNELYFRIENAPAGQWRVRKENNVNFEVQIMETAKPIYIQEFEVGEVNGNKLPVSFLVEGDGASRYDYRITAMIDHVGTEKELATGTGSIGRTVSKTLQLTDLATYGSYILKLQVSYEKDGAEIFDFIYSEPFSYTNTSLDEKAQDYDLTVAPDTGLLHISVPDLNRNVDGVMVGIFENGATEPTLFYDFTKEEAKNISLAYDPSATEVAVEVAIQYDGIYATPIRKTFRPKDMGISIPDGESFNHLILPMQYSGMNQQLVQVTVNGYLTELVLNESGNVNITLGDDWNTLDIRFTTDNRITWLLEREIYVDRVPPVLTMSQNYDGMSSENTTFTISGTVMDYDTVTINGVTITVEPTGLFTQELTLVRGANTIEVIAADKLGNQTKYTAVIYQGVTPEKWQEQEKQSDAPGGLLEILTNPDNYWVLLISGVLCIMVIGYALIFWRKEDKK